MRLGATTLGLLVEALVATPYSAGFSSHSFAAGNTVQDAAKLNSYCGCPFARHCCQI